LGHRADTREDGERRSLAAADVEGSRISTDEAASKAQVDLRDRPDIQDAVAA
jgi:hypothetical protein